MIRVWIFILSLSSSSGVIYQLNDTEYQRMPPLFSLDDYEPCLIEEGSTYCLVQLQLYAEPGNELMRMITEYSEHKLKHYNHTIIDRGVCVRKSCQKYISLDTTKDLKRSLEACLSDSLSREYGLNAKVSILYYCNHHNEQRYIDGWDWVVMLVIIGLVIINTIGSAYDYFLSKQRAQTSEDGNAFLLSFSIMRNWERLTNTTSDPKFQDLQIFHGIRVITNLSTIILHAVLTFQIGFSKNPHDIEKAHDLPLYLLILNGTNVIQLFFFISGFLTSYRLQIEKQKRIFTVWDVPKIMLLRFSRLVPALAVTLALATTWVRHVSSGPLWKLFVSGSLVADCRNYWWRHLFFINNYSDASKFCLLPTWQLAAEVQVFLVGMTAYIATQGRARRVVLSMLLLLGAAAPALHTVLQDLDTIIVMPQHSRTLEGGTFWLQHTLGHNNLPCFILGLATGTRLYHCQKKGGHLVKNRWYSLLQYLSLAAIPLILYSGHIFYSDGPQAPLLMRATYSTAIRLLLGLASALLVSSLFNRTPTYFKSLLEWQHWILPSRLTYSVFLLHMMVVHMIMGVRMQLSYFSFLNVISVLFLIVVVSYIISVPMYLMVEAPFTTLFKSFGKKQTFRNTFEKNGTAGVNETSGDNRKSNGNEDLKKKNI